MSRPWAASPPPCSRSARPQKEASQAVGEFLCSRSARPRKALARRPQLEFPNSLALRRKVSRKNRGLVGRAQLGPGQPPMGSLEIFERDEVKR